MAIDLPKDALMPHIPPQHQAVCVHNIAFNRSIDLLLDRHDDDDRHISQLRHDLNGPTKHIYFSLIIRLTSWGSVMNCNELIINARWINRGSTTSIRSHWNKPGYFFSFQPINLDIVFASILWLLYLVLEKSATSNNFFLMNLIISLNSLSIVFPIYTTVPKKILFFF